MSKTITPAKLEAAIDNATGCVVLINEKSDIQLFVADGKMAVVRRDQECEVCTEANLALAKRLAELWNRSTAPVPVRRTCG